MSELQRKLIEKHGGSLPSRPPVGPSSKRTRMGPGAAGQRDYSPLPWTDFFDEKRAVKIEKNSFNVYLKGFKDLEDLKGPENAICIFCLHGGGYSGLTWACLAKSLSRMITCRFVAPDLRGHGDTVVENESDLSIDSLAEDVKKIFEALFGSADPPPIFLVGHSMGGALAVHVAHRGYISSLVGLTVIDVVEGSALDALQSMQNVLRNRPIMFRSQEEAVQWCIRAGTVRNLESARISMPSQVVKTTVTHAEIGKSVGKLVEEEEEEEGGGEFKAPIAPSAGKIDVFTWRIDLAKTEPFWDGWFRGLSKMFLAVPQPKLLLLAGVDRLDKDLTIGQIQGKFQMTVLPKVGHALHEDSPESVAEVLATFCVRNKFAEAIGEFTPVFPGC